MGTVKLNITLPIEIAKDVDSLLGTVDKSSFIVDCLRHRIKQIEKENLLKEGYKNTKLEGLALAKEFESIDLEGWDKY